MVGTVYWITGLSGAGKTTIGKLFYEKLKALKKGVIFLDGDILRAVFGYDLSHTQEDRRRCALRYCALCKMLSDQGVDVICCTISMFHECHDWNRKHIGSYKEIFIEVSMDQLKKRDKKGIYSGGGKNVVGVDIEAEFPRDPDMVISNDGTRTPENIADEILNWGRR